MSVLAVADDHDRYADAPCRGMVPEFDVPSIHQFDGDIKMKNSVTNQRIRAAKVICGSCPVVRMCAEDAVAGFDTGVIRAGVALINGRSRRALADHWRIPFTYVRPPESVL